MIEATISKNYAIVRTDDQFVIVIKDNIHGPFEVKDAPKLLKAMEEN